MQMSTHFALDARFSYRVVNHVRLVEDSHTWETHEDNSDFDAKIGTQRAAHLQLTIYARIVTSTLLLTPFLWQQWPSACRKRRWCRPPWSAGCPAGRRPHAPRSPVARCTLTAAISARSCVQGALLGYSIVTWASAPICPSLCTLVRMVMWELVLVPSMSMQRVNCKYATQAVVRGKDDALGRCIIRVSPAAHALGVQAGAHMRASDIQLILSGCAASQVTKALSDTNLIIGGATAASLALGRFVLLPVQRRFNKKAGLPQQNGVSNAEAGDRQARALAECDLHGACGQAVVQQV